MGLDQVAATTPFVTGSIKTEVNNAASPLHSVYATFTNPVGSGADAQGIADALNALTGAGTGQVPANDLTPAQFWNLVPAGEYAALPSATQQQVVNIIQPMAPVGSSGFQAKIAAVLAGQSGSLSAIAGAATRTGCRREVLWGTGLSPITAVQVQNDMAS